MKAILLLLNAIFLIPIRTDKEITKIPFVTYGIIFLNIFIYISTLQLSDAELHASRLRLGFVLSDFSWYTLITNAFLHSGWFHLAGNMFLLWITGTVLEAAIGRRQFLMLYLGSAILGTLLFALTTFYFSPPDKYGIPLIGASGAISGVIGFAAFRYYYINIQTIFAPIPLLVWIPFWTYALYFLVKEFLLGFFDTSGGNVAHFAHLGGLALGIGLGIAMRSYRDGLRDHVIEKAAEKAPNTQTKEFNETVTSLIKDNPDDPELLMTDAGLKVAAGENESAIMLFNRALNLSLRQGMYENAINCFENILIINHDTIFPSKLYLAMYTLYEKNNDTRHMNEIFETLMTRFSNTPEAESMLIKRAKYCAEIEGNIERAITYYKYLIEHYPNSSYINIATEELKKLRSQ